MKRPSPIMLHRFICSFIRQIVSRKLNSFREESLECTCQGLNLHLFGIKFLCDGYLLDSPSPYRLWFRFDLRSGVKDSIQANGLDCQRLLHEAKEELTAAF